jgi:hypothetical protein
MKAKLPMNALPISIVQMLPTPPEPSFQTKRGDNTAFLKHVSLLQKLQAAPHLIQSVYNKCHESLKASAIAELTNADIYNIILISIK